MQPLRPAGTGVGHWPCFAKISFCLFSRLGDQVPSSPLHARIVSRLTSVCARQRGEPQHAFHVPTIPEHLAITKQTPHDLCLAVANYEPFCRTYSKDKALAHFLVNPCGRKTALSAWDKGRCCRCDLHTEKCAAAVHQSTKYLSGRNLTFIGIFFFLQILLRFPLIFTFHVPPIRWTDMRRRP